MTGQRFAVDGYNLIHKIPELKALVERDLELARERLVGMLAGYAAGRRIAITIVFDGRRVIAGTRGDSRSGVRVVFARADADSYIKQLLERERSPRSWTVVTSDNSIRRYVADYGAKLLRSEDFARQLLPSTPVPVPAGGRDERPLSAGEIADWERWFAANRPRPVDSPKRRPKMR